MAIVTRWFVCKLGRLSQIPAWRKGAARGTVPAICEALVPGDLGGGSWMSHAPAAALGLSIAAISFDTRFHGDATRAAVWSKLNAYPDARVYQIGAPQDLPANEAGWTRRDGFATMLANHRVDVARFRDSTRSVRYHVRELARELSFLGLLGRHHHALEPTAVLGDLTPNGRAQLFDHLLEQGFPSSKLPDATTTFRDFYRAALADPFCDFGLEAGTWHLGHPAANLGRA